MAHKELWQQEIFIIHCHSKLRHSEPSRALKTLPLNPNCSRNEITCLPAIEAVRPLHYLVSFSVLIVRDYCGNSAVP